MPSEPAPYSQPLRRVRLHRPGESLRLYPRKGTIAVGADADLVILDPNKAETSSTQTHHMGVDYSMFEGIRVKGVPRWELVNGRW